MESKGRPGLDGHREESALNMFRQMDLKGKVKDDTQLKTVHQNSIATVRIYDETGGVVRKFSSKSKTPSPLYSSLLKPISEWRRWPGSDLVCVTQNSSLML